MNVGGSATHMSMELWLRRDDFKQVTVAGKWRSYNTIVAVGSAGLLLRVKALGNMKNKYVDPIVNSIEKGGMKWKY